MTGKKELLPQKRRGGKVKFDAKRQELFLKIFKECNSITQAAKAVSISTNTVYEAKASDLDFRASLERAERDILSNLEEEAYRRAVKGVKKAVYHQGRLVGYELQYSDRLLEMMLRARDRDRYTQSTNINVQGKVEHDIGGNVVMEKLLERALRMKVIKKGEDIEDAQIIEGQSDSEDEEGDEDEM